MESQNSSLSTNKESSKIFHDPVHGHIELHPLLVKIIDTPEFQRLRNLKQLGALYHVFPGASHNRFEHCIGTYYIASQLVSHLVKIQDGLLTDEEARCVQIAALCHDLGHGPFSHLFDGVIIPTLKPEGYKNWKHELGSIKLFDIIVKKYNLEAEFMKLGLGFKERHLIKEMIYGPLKMDEENPFTYEKAKTYQARTDSKKHFLYEIVSNETNGIDVDKWDYFARDCLNLGIANNFDYKRFIQFSRVVKCENTGKHHICVRDKEVENAYEMFHTRFRLHRQAYQHPVKLSLEKMIADAVLLAGNSLWFTKPDGTSFKMADAINDMEAYIQLDDGIFYQIIRQYENKDFIKAKNALANIKDLDEESIEGIRFLRKYLEQRCSSNMESARQLLTRFLKRDIYRLVKKESFPKDVNIENVQATENEIADTIVQHDTDMTANDIVVKIVKFNYGMKERNPIDNLSFYTKRNPDESFQISKDKVSYLLPSIFQEQVLFVFVKDASKKDSVERCLDEWMKDENKWTMKHDALRTPEHSSQSEQPPAPMKLREHVAQSTAVRKLELEDDPPAKKSRRSNVEDAD